ncbi:Divalent cation transporter [Seminavis robusta]|uniref:Divalent cation transporter n=1 Tax=Seminavis robusta TaxID=568900 RepID=A0A9N8H2J9_9STRA|nr:Divalent cation transporter [Seminavis robusta]|eukprot:Sro38_g023620.1 Divalent cation transporter (445) ;mRNA; r:42104-43516
MTAPSSSTSTNNSTCSTSTTTSSMVTRKVQVSRSGFLQEAEEEEEFADLEALALDEAESDLEVERKERMNTTACDANSDVTLEEENLLLKEQVEEMKRQLEYWKLKATSAGMGSGGTGTASVVATSSNNSFFEGLKHISFSPATPATPVSSSAVEMQYDSRMGLHQRRSIPKEKEGYFDNWNISSPFKFTTSSTYPEDEDDQEGVSLVTATNKSHASDRDEEEDEDDDESHHHLHASPNSPTHASPSADEDDNGEPNSLVDRGAWLVGLLVLQSFSSFIIKNNEAMLHRHAVIVRFLTMLVGAGGNAGNQASVRVIRGLATGKVDIHHNMRGYLVQELRAGFFLSVVLGVAGAIRAAVFFTPLAETFAITASLVMIVGISIFLGTILPLFMKMIHIDPAHSSTTIQVLMDILGVAITVYVSSIVLDTKVFEFLKPLPTQSAKDD